MRVLYLLRAESGDRDKFREDLLGYAKSCLCPLAEHLVIAVSDVAPPKISVIPFRKDLVGLVSMEGVKSTSRWPEPPGDFAGAYQSEVALPVVHEQDWKMGERSPGAGLFTIFRRRKGLDEQAFLRRWYDGHTTLTLEVHPNVGYVRNRVTGNCSDAGPSGEIWDGIVEEQYDPPEDLLKPSRFFGGSQMGMLPTMLRVYRDVKGFIDYSSIHTWLTSEYRLK